MSKKQDSGTNRGIVGNESLNENANKSINRPTPTRQQVRPNDPPPVKPPKNKAGK